MRKRLIPKRSNEIAPMNQILFLKLFIAKSDRQTDKNKTSIPMSMRFIPVNGSVRSEIIFEWILKIVRSQLFDIREIILISDSGQIIEMTRQIAAAVRIKPRAIEIIIPDFLSKLIIISLSY
jgi:hypothetical protein